MVWRLAFYRVFLLFIAISQIRSHWTECNITRLAGRKNIPPGKLVRIDSTPLRRIASPQGWPLRCKVSQLKAFSVSWRPNLTKKIDLFLRHCGVFEILLVWHDMGWFALGFRLFPSTKDIKKSQLFSEPALSHVRRFTQSLCKCLDFLEKASSDFQSLPIQSELFKISATHCVSNSLDEWVGEEEHQGNDQAVNGQGLHECQGQQQHTSQVICHLRLTGDAVNASSRSNALANTGTDRCQANGEASANGRQGRDPHGALVSECCLWCHQSSRGQSCCSSSVCGRGRCMGAARGRHESSQECSAAQQHGTSQDEGAGHGYRSRSSNFAAQLGIEWSGIFWQTAANTEIIAHASMQMDLPAAAFSPQDQ